MIRLTKFRMLSDSSIAPRRLLGCLCACLVLSSMAVAQDDLQKLRDDQEAVAGRYARFERLLSQMADMMAREDPERADLLRRAISEGREKAITGELDAISASLQNNSFGTAREKQGQVIKNMQQILTLLQSEDRRSEVEKERERLNNLLKDLRNLTARQKAARAAAQNSRSPSSAAPDQQQTLKKAEDILDDVESHDESQQEEADAESSGEQSGDQKSGDQKSGEGGEQNQSGKPSDPKDGDSEKSSKGESSSKENDGEKSGDEESSDGDGKDSKSQAQDPQKSDGKSGKPQDSDSQSDSNSEQQSEQSGQQSDSQQSQQGSQQQQQGSQQNQQSDESQQTPGREQLEEARQAMQEAIEQLKQQQRDEALKDQDEAIKKLQEAQKKLEETLKQLREEEKEMILAALEARFQRMLSLQTQIYEETVALGSTPRDEWLNTAVTQCRKLGQQQSDLTRECSLTVGLLREDGTSVSILIAVEDIETDMRMVAGRLQETKAFELTQSMQTDVIEALKELIETAQKEMEEMKQDQNQQQQQQSGPQGKSALVELMAEIKVLRSLQLRVNRRTATVDRLLQEGDPAEEAGLLQQLEELAVRQNRLTESANELARQMEQRR